MIAEDRPHAERGGEAREFAGPDFGGNLLGDEPMMGNVIAEQDHEVGSQRIGRVDHAADVLDRHVGAAGMDIGDRRHRERGLRSIPAG